MNIKYFDLYSFTHSRKTDIASRKINNVDAIVVLLGNGPPIMSVTWIKEHLAMWKVPALRCSDSPSVLSAAMASYSKYFSCGVHGYAQKVYQGKFCRRMWYRSSPGGYTLTKLGEQRYQQLKKEFEGVEDEMKDRTSDAKKTYDHLSEVNLGSSTVDLGEGTKVVIKLVVMTYDVTVTVGGPPRVEWDGKKVTITWD